jgi:hypothetical protein
LVKISRGLAGLIRDRLSWREAYTAGRGGRKNRHKILWKDAAGAMRSRWPACTAPRLGVNVSPTRAINSPVTRRASGCGCHSGRSLPGPPLCFWPLSKTGYAGRLARSTGAATPDTPETALRPPQRLGGASPGGPERGLARPQRGRLPGLDIALRIIRAQLPIVHSVAGANCPRAGQCRRLAPECRIRETRSGRNNASCTFGRA